MQIFLGRVRWKNGVNKTPPTLVPVGEGRTAPKKPPKTPMSEKTPIHADPTGLNATPKNFVKNNLNLDRDPTDQVNYARARPQKENHSRCANDPDN